MLVKPMKILSTAWNIYDDRLQEFSMNCTGGGLVIKNICEYLGRTEQSYLLLGRYSLPAMKIGNINLVDTETLAGKNSNVHTNSHHLVDMTKSFELALEKIKPDIVNIHDFGDFSLNCMARCAARQIPYVCTSHLYIGLQKEIAGYENTVLVEQKVYSLKGIKIIAVSTGMKKRILEDYPCLPEDDIHVIQNGTDFKAERIPSKLREQYKIGAQKVLLCVGTLLERKNQTQLIEIFKLLPEKIQNNLVVLFCGRDGRNGQLQREIKEAGLQDKLIYAGAFESKEMKKFYSIADGLISTSIAEGLSIAMLEMLTYGKPIIMSSDSECAEDLKDERAVCFAEDRTDKSFVKAVTQWYERTWNDDDIIRYSKQFTMEKTAKNYIKCYQHILGEKEDETNAEG